LFIFSYFQARSQNCVKGLLAFIMSVLPDDTTPLPLKGFPLNFIFEDLSKIYKHSSLIEI